MPAAFDFRFSTAYPAAAAGAGLAGALVTAPPALAVGRAHYSMICAEDGGIMGVAHRKLPVFGVQFHPESIESEHGHRLLGNFLGFTGGRRQAA